MEQLSNMVRQGKHYQTPFEIGEQHGQSIPSPAGPSHAAWKLFDILTPIVKGQPHPPTLADAVDAGVACGLNKKNLEREFNPWCYFNGFKEKPGTGE